MGGGKGICCGFGGRLAGFIRIEEKKPVLPIREKERFRSGVNEISVGNQVGNPRSKVSQVKGGVAFEATLAKKTPSGKAGRDYTKPPNCCDSRKMGGF